MKRDRAAFAVGVIAIALAGHALWASFATIDWRLTGLIAPVVLIIIGAGMLVLSAQNHTSRKGNPK